MRAALQLIGDRFIDGLKTDLHREALDTVRDVDGMSDEEFAGLLAKRMSILDEEEQEAAKTTIARRIERWSGDDDAPLSLREEILLDLQAMIQRHNYYAGQGR